MRSCVFFAFAINLIVTPCIAFAITPKYQQAMDFAYQYHKGETISGSTVPYIAHLEGVASIIWKQGGTEDECAKRSA